MAGATTMSTELWLATGGLVLTALGFGVGLWQYHQGQRWKRMEFLLQEMKEFREDDDVQTALVLLDWNAATADMLPSRPPGAVAVVDDSDLQRALVDHRRRKEGFDPTEAWLRRVFDALLDRFERYGHHLQGRHFAPKDFAPYLEYWLKLFADASRKPPEVHRALREYIDVYHPDARLLFEAFGIDVAPGRRVEVVQADAPAPLPRNA